MFLGWIQKGALLCIYRCDSVAAPYTQTSGGDCPSESRTHKRRRQSKFIVDGSFVVSVSASSCGDASRGRTCHASKIVGAYVEDPNRVRRRRNAVDIFVLLAAELSRDRRRKFGSAPIAVDNSLRVLRGRGPH